MATREKEVGTLDLTSFPLSLEDETVSEQEPPGNSDNSDRPMISSKALDRLEEEVSNEKVPDEEEDSPYEVVRSTVSTKDDPSLPVMTFRYWVLALIFTCALSFVNQFFFFREVILIVGILVVQLVTFPLGKLMARILPRKSITLPRFLTFSRTPYKMSLNPGPFNIKEHVLIAVCANASTGTAYAIDIITIKKLFYKSDIGFFGGFLMVLSTQCLGYGMAGILRRFLVHPASMIWPTNLVNVALFRTLHEGTSSAEKSDSDRHRMGRLKFFCIVLVLSAAYYVLPGYLFSVLTTCSLLCWIAPHNHVAQQLGSGQSGLGILAFSLDWNTIVSFLLSPLATPFWAECNIVIGFIFIIWVLIPIGYYTNIWDTQRFPILTSSLFNNRGEKYNITRVTPNHHFSLQAYNDYGPVNLTWAFAITYGVGFATLASVISYVWLHHRHEIAARFRESRDIKEDIHSRLMRAYPEVPNWWYALVFMANLAIAVVVCECFDINLPWWALLLAVAISAIFVLPIGIIQAITNQQPGLNIITEFIIGLILPGEPIANVTFKTYGYISMVQALAFASDLKLGHYMKIPPRSIFVAQIVGTVIAGVINLATAYYLMDTIADICTEKAYPWTCSNARVFMSASVIWGLVGPARMFGPDSPYHSLLWCFLIGFLLPIPFHYLARRYPNSLWQYVHIPILIGATGLIPPAPPVEYPTWFLVGFVFQFLVYRYRHEWWKRYNYLLSAGMDSGVAISALVIFFAFQYHDIKVDWWGNDDSGNCPLASVPLKNSTV